MVLVYFYRYVLSKGKSFLVMSLFSFFLGMSSLVNAGENYDEYDEFSSEKFEGENEIIKVKKEGSKETRGNLDLGNRALILVTKVAWSVALLALTGAVSYSFSSKVLALEKSDNSMGKLLGSYSSCMEYSFFNPFVYLFNFSSILAVLFLPILLTVLSIILDEYVYNITKAVSGVELVYDKKSASIVRKMGHDIIFSLGCSLPFLILLISKDSFAGKSFALVFFLLFSIVPEFFVEKSAASWITSCKYESKA